MTSWLVNLMSFQQFRAFLGDLNDPLGDSGGPGVLAWRPLVSWTGQLNTQTELTKQKKNYLQKRCKCHPTAAC